MGYVRRHCHKADKTEIPTNLSDLAEDSTHRTVTDVEKTTDEFTL